MPPYILENLSSPIDDPFAVMPPRDPNDDDDDDEEDDDPPVVREPDED